MSLDLDARQRAMLAEMGVRVWQRPALEAPMPAVATTSAPPRTVSTPRPLARSATVPATSALTGAAAAPGPLPTQGSSLSLQAGAPQWVPADGSPMGWAALSHTVLECQACGLCAGRKAAVWGATPEQPQADWLLVGEPPDEPEERAGHSFAGAAGQLLDNMLKAVGASRGGTGRLGAYVTNVVKCRPARPRNPDANEMAICQAVLQQEIALVKPKLILAMGRFAAQSLLQAGLPDVAGIPLGKLRGQVHYFQHIPVVVSYHPTYLLRTPADKAKAWADLCLAMATLDAPASDNS